jgi:hypothetical protein
MADLSVLFLGQPVRPLVRDLQLVRPLRAGLRDLVSGVLREGLQLGLLGELQIGDLTLLLEGLIEGRRDRGPRS